MNKYQALTERFFEVLTSKGRLSSKLLFSFRVSNILLPKVSGDKISLILDTNEAGVEIIYLIIIANNGTEYQIPIDMFIDPDYFMVLSVDKIKSTPTPEDKETKTSERTTNSKKTEKEVTFLETLILLASDKVNEYNSISVDLNNLVRSGVPKSDSEYISTLTKATKLEAELSALSSLIKIVKKIEEYTQEGLTSKVDSLWNLAEKVLDTFKSKYNYDFLDNDTKKEDTLDKARNLLLNLIETVQAGEKIDTYTSKVDNFFTNLGIRNTNIKDSVKSAYKTEVKKIKDLLINELLKK